MCASAKKKIEDKFLQIYLNKDLVHSDTFMPDLSDLD